MATLERSIDSTVADGDRSPVGPRGRPELLHACRASLVEHLDRAVAEVLGAVGESLGAEALRCDRPEPQRVLREAAMLAGEQRGRIAARFQRAFDQAFERRLYALDAAARETSPAELSLVPEDVFNDQLALERLIGRVRARLEPDEVLGIRARLGELIGRAWFEEGSHPASPEAVFEALQDAIGALSPRQEVTVALLEAFEPHLASRLNAIYATVNAQLRAGDVLPIIRPQVRAAGSAARRAPSARLDGIAATARAAPPAAIGLEAAPTAEVAPAWAQDPAGLSDPGEAFRLAMAAIAEGRPNGRAHAVRMLSNPRLFGAGADRSGAPVARPLLGALGALQRDHGAGDGHRMPTELVERVREQGSPLDRVTVEIVSMVFDYIYADRRLPDTIKQQLLRLQVVAVKAALLDRSFFARRAHPMRRLIDRVSDVGADPDSDLGPASTLVLGLSATVDRVLSAFDTDLAVFDEALSRIELLVRDEASRRAACVEQTARRAAREEALAVAYEDARAVIQRRVGADVPPFVRGFLDRWWTLVLARVRIEQPAEAGAQAWDAALRIVDLLVWSVAPKHIDQIARLARLLPALIRGLNQGLLRVEMSVAERDAFFDELLLAHTREIDVAKRRAQALVAPPGGVPVVAPPARDGDVAAEPPAPGAAGADAAAAAVADALLCGLRRGQRVALSGDDGQRLLKLAWISPMRKLFILSRHPDETVTFGAAELAFLLQRGHAAVVPEDSTVERAIGSLSAGDPTPAAPVAGGPRVG
jgi:hypothetical protein